MRILVQRYSALGDIFILLPILQQLKLHYPQVQLGFVSKPFVEPLFTDLDIEFFPIKTKGKHKGLNGLHRFSRELLKDFKPDLVIDAHAVLRSMVLNASFQLQGLKVEAIQKDRKARKDFLKAKAQNRKPLQAFSQLHLNTLARAGFALPFDRNNIPLAPYTMHPETEAWWQVHKAEQNIGIAPGARHLTKAWPSHHFIDLMQQTKGENRRFFLFGGPDEVESLKKMGVESGADYQVIAGKFSLDQEIALCKNLNAFVSNDSSNMHLAAWSGIPVISIWGGTHPEAGFAPYGNEHLQLGLADDALDCRPCSIFGSSECKRGDFACLQELHPKTVAAKLSALL